MNLLIIDVGTSSMRSILYDSNATVLYSHQIQYDVLYRDKLCAEQNPQDWKNALYAIAGELQGFCSRNQLSIDALSLTSQRSSIIPILQDGTPLCNAIMWMDKRNSRICEELKPYEQEIVSLAGARINAVFSGSKMTWLRQNEPELYKNAYKLLTIADYLAFLITGEFRTDETYASRSSLMNIRTRRWDSRLLELYRVDAEKLCDIAAPGSILGRTSESFFAATGIPAGIPYISAGGDQQCAALGLGVIQPGDMELTTGTGAFMLAYASEVPTTLKSEVICGAHAVPGCYVMESSMISCASLYDWFRNNFYREAVSAPDRIEKINAEIASAAPGADGCIVLPYFQGRGTPDFNAAATGSFHNLTLNTTRASMARAILEAIALEAANNISLLEGYTGTVKKLYISGGLTHFTAFNQLQADVYQKELVQYESAEQTALGAWISAAVTMGLFRDYHDAVSAAKAAEHITTYLPDAGKKELYENKRAAMNELYRRLTN